MNNHLLKAVGLGLIVFLIMMGIFWGVARFYGNPLFFIPQRAVPAETPEQEPTPTPDLSAPPFLQ